MKTKDNFYSISLKATLCLALIVVFGGLASCISDLEEKRDAGVVDDMEFCACVSLEDIDKTIPAVNQYLGTLNKNRDNEQRLHALAAWLKSFPCIIDSRMIQNETMPGFPPKTDIAFSFMDDEIIRELLLDISTADKVVSYHYDIVNGAHVKTNRHITIDRAFDFVNSFDFDVKSIYLRSYVSTMPSENLQYILDKLNAKPYTNRDNWQVTGYLKSMTNQIIITARLFDMENKAYQADWIQSMNDYQLIEDMSFDFGGHIIEFRIPENPENKGVPEFDEYEIVEWVDYSYNRYTIYDKSIEKEKSGHDVSIDSKINIRMTETIDTSPRTFQLNCSTTKIYPHTGYPLIVAHQLSTNNIDLSFKGVVEGSPGFAVLSPANATINLGAINSGTYNLNLYNGNVKRKAKLIISADSYEISLDNNSHFQFTNTTLNKIPEHTIWGTIGYNEQQTSSIAQSFLDELMALGAEKKSYNPGHYQEFEIGKNGKIVPPTESGYYYAQSFIFNYSGDIANIEQLFKRNANEYKTAHLSVSVYTDKGEKLLSWMYE